MQMRFIVYIAVFLLSTTSAIAAVERPSIKVPANITVTATSDAGAIVTFAASIEGKAAEDFNLTCTPASGSVFPVGKTVVKCKARHKIKMPNLVRAGKSFYVTVTAATTQAESSTTFSLIVPDAITVTTDNPEGRNVAFNTSATNVLGEKVDVKCTPQSGSFFSIGSTNVKCSSSTGKGWRTSDSFYVNVIALSTPSSDLDKESNDVTDSSPVAPDPVVTPTQEPEPTPESVEPQPESVEPELAQQTTTDTEPAPQPEPTPEPEPEAALPTITISWAAPTTRKDGSPLLASEIGGYDIFIVAESSGNDQTININDPSISEYVFQATAADVYYISISTYDSQGNSSDLSNTESVSIP